MSAACGRRAVESSRVVPDYTLIMVTLSVPDLEHIVCSYMCAPRVHIRAWLVVACVDAQVMPCRVPLSLALLSAWCWHMQTDEVVACVGAQREALRAIWASLSPSTSSTDLAKRSPHSAAVALAFAVAQAERLAAYAARVHRPPRSKFRPNQECPRRPPC